MQYANGVDKRCKATIDKDTERDTFKYQFQGWPFTTSLNSAGPEHVSQGSLLKKTAQFPI